MRRLDGPPARGDRISPPGAEPGEMDGQTRAYRLPQVRDRYAPGGARPATARELVAMRKRPEPESEDVLAW